jgi:RNA recognition motif-containing protein
MKLALGQITEVVGPMATAGVVATVEVEVADPEEEDREDIKLPLPHFYLTHTIYINYSGGLLAKRRSWITSLPRRRGNMNIYVGNLSLEVTEGELRQEFMAFGEVLSVTVMNDKYIGSGQSRGYAFVEMPSQSESESAITALNGKSLKHRTIDVIQALPLSDNKDKEFLHTRSISHFSGRGRKRRY